MKKRRETKRGRLAEEIKFFLGKNQTLYVSPGVGTGPGLRPEISAPVPKERPENPRSSRYLVGPTPGLRPTGPMVRRCARPH